MGILNSLTVDSSGGVKIKNGSTSGGFIEIYENSSNGTNKLSLKAPETIGKKYGVDSLITKKGDTPEDHINKAFARLEFAKSIGDFLLILDRNRTKILLKSIRRTKYLFFSSKK